MRYLFDLLQKERHKEVVAFLVIGILGILLIANFVIQIKEFAVVTFNPLDEVNIWIPVFGLFLIYLGFFYLPSINPFVTNKEDYMIEDVEKGIIRIRYQDYSFSILKEGKLNRSCFYPKDEQGKRVSFRLASRIYSGLMTYHARTILDIKEGKNIVENYTKSAEDEDVYKYGTREATAEEIEKYKKSKKFPSSKVSVFMIIVALILLGIHGTLERSDVYLSDIVQLIFAIVFIFFAVIGARSGLVSIYTNMYQRYMKFGKVYIGDCYVIEKRYHRYRRNRHYTYIYYVRVKNESKEYESHWIQVDADIYHSEDEKYKIIAVKYKNKTILDVRRQQDFI